MLLKLKYQDKYLPLVVLLFLCEVAIALFFHDTFIRPFFGDFLATIGLFYFFKMISTYKNWTLACLSLGIAFVLELAQYLEILKLFNLQNIKWLAKIVGNSYAKEDLFAYTLGILAALAFQINFVQYYFPDHE